MPLTSEIPCILPWGQPEWKRTERTQSKQAESVGIKTQEQPSIKTPKHHHPIAQSKPFLTSVQQRKVKLPHRPITPPQRLPVAGGVKHTPDDRSPNRVWEIVPATNGFGVGRVSEEKNQPTESVIHQHKEEIAWSWGQIICSFLWYSREWRPEGKGWSRKKNSTSSGTIRFCRRGGHSRKSKRSICRNRGRSSHSTRTASNQSPIPFQNTPQKCCKSVETWLLW